MRLTAALVIVLLPAAAFGQSKAAGSDFSTNGTSSYGGGSAYGGGSYSGPTIDTPQQPDPGETRTQQPALGGNYGYAKDKPRQTH